MEKLIAKFHLKLRQTPTFFVRDFLDTIDWNNRFIGIKGARGVGKTTLLLQFVKLKLGNPKQALYVSLDDLYFRRTSLYDLVEQFVQKGGQWLLLDEVHRYPDWSQELKNIYDDFFELKVIFTGSSIVQLSKSKGDLSRRAMMYTLHGLSFREYLQVKKIAKLDILDFQEILENHTNLALDISQQLHPLSYFSDYLKIGYYPFFLENEAAYSTKLNETVNLLLETDIPAVHHFTTATIEKLKTFLLILAESVPFKPNITKLANLIGVNRNTVLDFLYVLEDAHLLSLLHRDRKGITRLQKPEKVFLANPNLFYALNSINIPIGTVRETFFINQVSKTQLVQYTDPGDFKVASEYTFEVGGKNKKSSQISTIKNAYVVADDIEVGAEKKIPLWLFGLLY